MNESEAVMAFLGWLTCRDEAVTFSARHDASEAVKLFEQYQRKQEWPEIRDGWELQIKPMK